VTVNLDDLDDENPAHSRLVRPYMVTRGRTATQGLLVETMVQARPSAGEALIDESRRVFELCTRPTAVAEVAAHLGLPLGITRVLVSDLVAEGRLEAFDTASPDDATIVRRILHAIRPE
jgi:hypothetical protein